MSFETDAQNRDSLAALAVTAATLAVFLIVLATAPALLSPLRQPFFAENLETFGSVDTRPQFYAYFAAIAFLGSVTLFDLTAIVARRLPGWAPHAPGAAEIGARLSRYGWVMRWASTAALVACVAKTLQIAAAALHDPYIPAALQNASDPHIFSVIAEKGETLLRAREALTTSVYGLLLPSLYAIGAHLGINWNYLNVYRLLFGLNAVFVLIWTFSAWRLVENRALSFLLGLMLLGPLAKLLMFAGEMVYLPNISAYRVLPFGLLFAFCVVAARRSLLLKIAGAAILSGLGIFISQDSGVVAAFGFLAFVLLHDVLDLKAFARAAAFLLATAAALAALQFLLRAAGVDLLGSVALSFSSGTSGYAGLALKWRDPNWVAAIASIYFFTLCATRARRAALTPPLATAAVLSGVSLLWFLYYVYRPSDSYWIYAAIFYPVAAVLLTDIAQRRDALLGAGLAAGLCVVSSTWVDRTLQEAQFLRAASAFRASEDATETFGGVAAARSRVDALANRKQALARLDADMSEMQPITALPFASLLLAPQTRLPIDAVFDFSSPPMVEAWRRRLCQDLPRYLVFDGPQLSSFSKPVTEGAKAHASASVADLYERLESNDVIEIWRRKADSAHCGAAH